MKMSCFWLALLFPVLLQAQQNYIVGKVVDGSTGAAIPNASVFVNGTSIGTVSAEDGHFTLKDLLTGTYDLVVSSIGYNTQVYTFSSSRLPLKLQIQLEPKTAELQAVTVLPFLKDGWERYGRVFLETFIGTSAEAKECKLQNPKALLFRHSKKKRELTVVATEPLIIENKALGYTIKYQLENYSYTFSEGLLFFMGYPLIQDIPTRREGLKKRWARARERAYKGSMMHFARSLYENRLEEDGFEVRRLVKEPNYEKARVKQVLANRIIKKTDSTMVNEPVRTIVIGGSGAPSHIVGDDDSASYYRSVLQQDDIINKYGADLLTADSVVSGNVPEKRLFFRDYLYITYKPAKEAPEYLLYTNQSRDPYYQRSTIYLVQTQPVTITSNGSYYPPQDVVSFGYWAWGEKMAHLLPLDYEPPAAATGK